MSTSMRSLLSAVLALVLLVLFTAPLSRGLEENRAACGVRPLAQDAIQSDGVPQQLPFVKPHVAESIVAERGFDETEAVHSVVAQRVKPSLSARPENQSSTQEPDARRALLRVYRL